MKMMLSAMSQNKHHQYKHLKAREAPTPKPASEVIFFQPPGGSRNNHTDRLCFSSYWELVSKLLPRTEKNIYIHLAISMICFSRGGSYHFLRKMKKKGNNSATYRSSRVSRIIIEDSSYFVQSALKKDFLTLLPSQNKDGSQPINRMLIHELHKLLTSVISSPV